MFLPHFRDTHVGGLLWALPRQRVWFRPWEGDQQRKAGRETFSHWKRYGRARYPSGVPASTHLARIDTVLMCSFL